MAAYAFSSCCWPYAGFKFGTVVFAGWPGSGAFPTMLSLRASDMIPKGVAASAGIGRILVMAPYAVSFSLCRSLAYCSLETVSALCCASLPAANPASARPRESPRLIQVSDFAYTRMLYRFCVVIRGHNRVPVERST